MIGESIITGVINGFFTRHQIDKWARLILSCAATAFCTFFFTIGSAGLLHLSAGHGPGLSITYAVFEACITMAALVLFRWTHSSLTKNIPISVPGGLMTAENKILENQNVATIGNDK